jgi:hypothetical protein
MGRSIGAMGLRPYHGRMSTALCGPAVTVRVRPGDNLMIHKALMMVEPGDVLVIDGGGDLTQALVGGLMRTAALAKKLGGLVIDGAIRDLQEWAEDGMPIFARGHTHRGPSKEGPGEINIPIACAGLAVLPGDLMLRCGWRDCHSIGGRGGAAAGRACAPGAGGQNPRQQCSGHLRPGAFQRPAAQQGPAGLTGQTAAHPRTASGRQPDRSANGRGIRPGQDVLKVKALGAQGTCS